MPLSSSNVQIIHRAIDEFLITSHVHVVVPPGAHTLDILRFHGGVRIIEQQAEIVEATLITDLTGLYADVWDGTNAVNVTTGGIVLSGAPSGTRFFKGSDITQPFDFMLADQIRIYEPGGPKVGDPYVVNPKNGVDNVGRVHFATTSGIDVVFGTKFVYQPLDGGFVTFA